MSEAESERPTFELQVRHALEMYAFEFAQLNSDGSALLAFLAPNIANAIEAAMAHRYYDARHKMRTDALAALAGAGREKPNL